MNFFKYILIFICFNLSAQFTVDKSGDMYLLSFADGSQDVTFLFGEEINKFSTLDLTANEYKAFVKQLNKLIRKNEGEIETSKYVLSKFSFSEESIFMKTMSGAIATITKEDIEKL